MVAGKDRRQEITHEEEKETNLAGPKSLNYEEGGPNEGQEEGQKEAKKGR